MSPFLLPHSPVTSLIGIKNIPGMCRERRKMRRKRKEKEKQFTEKENGRVW